MSDRANQLITDILRRIHEAIVEHDVTYEEYQAAKQWFIDVGEAGEWPLFGDVYIEHVVEEQAFGNRAGSQGTILGPFHLPDAPLLDAPFELPHRADESGDRTARLRPRDRRRRHPARERQPRHLAGGRRGALLGLHARSAGGQPARPGPHRRRRPLRVHHRDPRAVHDPARRADGQDDGGGGLEPVAPGAHPPDRQRRRIRAAGHPAVHRHQRLPRQRRRQRGQARADRPPGAGRRRRRSRSATTSRSPRRARRRSRRPCPRSKVAVVGGGIGGLVLALALRERGIGFEVYEQARRSCARSAPRSRCRQTARASCGGSGSASRSRPSRSCPRRWSSGAGIPARSSPITRSGATGRTRRRSARPTTACIASRSCRRSPTGWAARG